MLFNIIPSYTVNAESSKNLHKKKRAFDQSQAGQLELQKTCESKI